MESDFIYMVYLVLALLLPLAPAYLLYKNLPSTAVVSGPFKGLTVQLSGAFAAYFILVLMVQGYILLRPKPRPPVEMYMVHGRLSNVDKQSVDDVVQRIALRPDGRTSSPEGEFSLAVLVVPDASGDRAFPHLVIQYPEYETKSVDLSNSPIFHQEYEAEHKNKQITIKQPIALRKKDLNQPYAEGQ
jgi:hypothetical protein